MHFLLGVDVILISLFFSVVLGSYRIFQFYMITLIVTLMMTNSFLHLFSISTFIEIIVMPGVKKNID